MAVNTQRSTSNKKRTPGNSRTTGRATTKGKGTTRGKKPVSPSPTMLRDEIILWGMLAISVIILISNFGLGGSLGGKISSIFFGLFGFMAYLVPFILFFSTAFFVSNMGNKVAWIKTAAIYVFLISLCGIFEMVVNGFDDTKKIAEYYSFSAGYKTGGGFFGGILSKAFCPTVGIVGAYVVILVLLIICIVLITEKSLFAGMQKHTSRMYEHAKKDVSIRREISAVKREQKEQQREQGLKDTLEQVRAESAGVIISPREVLTPKKAKGISRLGKKVTGVSLDTSLASQEEQLVMDDIQEVMPSLKDTGLPKVDFTIDRGGQKPEPAENKEQEAVVAVEETELFDIPVLQPYAPDIEADEMPKLNTPVLNIPKEAIPKAPVKNLKSSKNEIEEGIQSVESEIKAVAEVVKPVYVFPPINLLNKPKIAKGGGSDKELRDTATKLQTTLHNFGVDVTVVNVSCGPSVTRYELMPEQGVKVSRIVNLADDIKLNLAAADIRIEAPIPGKSAVGIEVPNHENSAVMLRELLENEEFKNHPSNLAFAAGKDIAGKVVVTDIAKMPHLLIAGATGSGKSVCINTIIMSLLYKAKPEDVKLIMIDPKVVELSVYNGIPHLFIPVVTDPKKAAGALNWGVAEMTERYKKFADLNVRDLKGYNAKVESVADLEGEDKPEKLPQIVIIVDELADLMMVAPGEVEDSICRLAQLARAAGIHLIIATQRPSVNVITGLIKANMPSRIAFSVSSGVDSRTIIDMHGAEKLLGKGDMLFYPQGYQKPARVQGAFVSDTEVSDVVDYLTKKNMVPGYSQDIEEKINNIQQPASDGLQADNEVDTYFTDAGKFIIEKDKASIGMLQRVFKIGFNRAARIMDQLAEAGVVGEEEGTKPRKVLMSVEEFENYLDEYI